MRNVFGILGIRSDLQRRLKEAEKDSSHRAPSTSPLTRAGSPQTAMLIGTRQSDSGRVNEQPSAQEAPPAKQTNMTQHAARRKTADLMGRLNGAVV